MTSSGAPIRILLIRSWTESLAELRAALRVGGITAQISRVDIEPALNAALSQETFDVIVFDPATKDLTKDMVITRLREHRIVLPVVELGPLERLAAAISEALRVRLN